MIDNEALHYLDNAATTRVAPEVADAIYKTMTNHWGNPSSLYTPGMESKELLLTMSVPHIAARGRKGGSNVAAAICNALLYTVSHNERE